MSGKRLTTVAVFCLLAFVFTFSCLAAPKKVLRVGTDATYPPFEFQDNKTGEFKGFSIDLIKALANEMKYDIKIINMGWEGIIPGLLNGNYDVIISSMTITPERKQAVNFSVSYFTAGQVIVTRKNIEGIKKGDDLRGKTISVQINTTGDLAASKIKGVKMKRFSTTPDALLELKNGGADASVVDEPLARYFIKEYPTLKIVGERFTSEDYGIAVNKKNTALLKEVNKAINALKKNGKYDQIYEKWFGKK